MKLMKFSNCRFTVAGDVYEFFLFSWNEMPYENFQMNFQMKFQTKFQLKFILR